MIDMGACIDFREKCWDRAAFDGVYRPEPWPVDGKWYAVAYTRNTLHGESHRDSARFEDERGAQARCDELNATREGVRHSQESPNRPQTLF
jgi:hypothetical protein